MPDCARVMIISLIAGVGMMMFSAFMMEDIKLKNEKLRHAIEVGLAAVGMWVVLIGFMYFVWNIKRG